MSSRTILDAGVRDDLAASHAETFVDLGRPGDWLGADEKTTLIRVVRAARADADQPPWYRPSTEQDDFEPLSATAVDIAWRVTNHPGTLTAEWYADMVGRLPSPEYYVELVGVVAVVNAIDRLATILDLDVLPVPDAEPGEPTRPTIPSSVTSHWVPTALDAGGPNVIKASSVTPAVAAMRTRLGAAQYLPTDARGDMDWSRGLLDRRQIELVAGATSLRNECFY